MNVYDDGSVKFTAEDNMFERRQRVVVSYRSEVFHKEGKRWTTTDGTYTSPWYTTPCHLFDYENRV